MYLWITFEKIQFYALKFHFYTSRSICSLIGRKLPSALSILICIVPPYGTFYLQITYGNRNPISFFSLPLFLRFLCQGTKKWSLSLSCHRHLTRYPAQFHLLFRKVFDNFCRSCGVQSYYVIIRQIISEIIRYHSETSIDNLICCRTYQFSNPGLSSFKIVMAFSHEVLFLFYILSATLSVILVCQMLMWKNQISSYFTENVFGKLHLLPNTRKRTQIKRCN